MARSYLDNNATTLPAATVIKTVTASLHADYGNPSSRHMSGQQARRLVEKARHAVAEMIQADNPSEIIFTSGGTESIFTVFRSLAERYQHQKWQIIVSEVEHIAVFEACKQFGMDANQVLKVAVNSRGTLDLQQLEDYLKSGSPAFVSLMWANNETGVKFPIEQISRLVKGYGATLHVDAVQAAGKMPIDAKCCDYLSLSAHKFHGLKGTGAIYVKQGEFFSPLINGHQEDRRRGGTENVPGILAMGEASRLVVATLTDDMARMRNLRDELENQILSSIPASSINGERENRLCNTSNILFPGKDASQMVERLSAIGVDVSAGAACTNGGSPSHVLQAMGLGREGAGASIRFSVCKFTTSEEIAFAVNAVNNTVATGLDAYGYN